MLRLVERAVEQDLVDLGLKTFFKAAVPRDSSSAAT